MIDLETTGRSKGLVAYLMANEKGDLLVRIDDTDNLAFWCEVVITKDEIDKARNV